MKRFLFLCLLLVPIRAIFSQKTRNIIGTNAVLVAAFTGCLLFVTALAGCQSNQQQIDELMQNQIEVASELEAAKQTLARFADILNQMDTRLRSAEDRITILNNQLAALEKKINPPVSSGTTTADKNSTEEPIVKIRQAISRMKVELDSNTFSKIADDLIAVSKDSVPLIINELKNSYTNLIFLKNAKVILAKMPPASLQTPLEEALKEKTVRQFAAEVIGEIANEDLAKLLEPHTSTQDDAFRIAIAEALVRSKNQNGIPLLLECLRSDSKDIRYIAYATLKKLSNGESFGYSYDLPSESTINKEAIIKWQNWWDFNKDKIFK